MLCIGKILFFLYSSDVVSTRFPTRYEATRTHMMVCSSTLVDGVTPDGDARWRWWLRWNVSIGKICDTRWSARPWLPSRPVMSRVGERRGRLSKVGEWLAIAQLGVEPGFYMGYSTIRCWLRVIDVIDVDAQLVCFHGDGDRFHKVGYLCWMPPIVRVRFLTPCFILIMRGLVTMARYPWLWALRFKCSMTPTLMWYLLYIICYVYHVWWNDILDIVVMWSYILTLWLQVKNRLRYSFIYPLFLYRISYYVYFLIIF